MISGYGIASNVLGWETSWVELGEHRCLKMLYQGRKGEGKRILVKIISKIAGRKTWDRLLLLDHKDGGEETGEQDTFLRAGPADLEHNFPGGRISEQLIYYSHSLFLLTLLTNHSSPPRRRDIWTNGVSLRLPNWWQSWRPKFKRRSEKKLSSSFSKSRGVWVGSQGALADHICCEAEKSRYYCHTFY